MKEIPLTRGLFALVDDDDFEWLSAFNWHADKNGYAVRNAPHPTVPGKRTIEHMHRTVLGLEMGDRTQVDHIDRNRANNQRNNLRKATSGQNKFNTVARVNNTSGYKGVCFFPRTSKWVAKIRIPGKRINLGYFDTPEAAHQAYKDAALRLHGEFANAG